VLYWWVSSWINLMHVQSCPREVHEDQIIMKNKRENERKKERKDKSSYNISCYTTKSIMLTHAMLQTAPPRCSSSLSFSLPNKTNYLTSWTKKFWDEHQTLPKGSHLLKGFLSSSPFIPKYSIQHGLYKELALLNSPSSKNIILFHFPHLTLFYKWTN